MNASVIISPAWLRTILFLIFLVNGLIYIPRQSITYDEGNHYNYASRFVKGSPEKIKPYDDASTMPFSALNTIPRIIEQLFNRTLKKTDNGKEDIINGRYVTLLISLLIGWYVYRWSRDLYGENAGLLSLFLYTFCPNISAYAGLVTTDVYSALFTIAPLFYFWKYTRTEQKKDLIWFSILLAVAQLTKQSLTYLYPLFIILVVIVYFQKPNVKAFKVKNLLRAILLVTVIQLAVINLGFQFNHTGQPLRNYEFKSRFFNHLKQGVGFFAEVPLPLPVPYLQGLDYTKNMDEWGGGANLITPYSYLFGERRMKTGFKYYYLVVSFYKIPIAILVFILVSIILMIKRKPRFLFYDKELYPVFTIIFFLAYFNLFYNSQVGIRHILLILPLLFVICGIIVQRLCDRNSGRIFVLANCLYGILSFYYYFPHLISYTNEFITDKKMAYKIMADSNLDYGHGNNYLNKFLMDHPSTSYAPKTPKAGRFIISVNDLVDVSGKRNYHWLRDHFKPTDHFIFAYLIFTISDIDLKNKGLNLTVE